MADKLRIPTTAPQHGGGTAEYPDPLPIETDASAEAAVGVVREWIEQAIPAEWRIAAEKGVEQLREVRPREAYEQWYPAFASTGLAIPQWPRAYGGLGVSSTTARAIEAELAPHRLGRLNILGINLAGSALLHWGTEEQKRRYLIPIVRNEEQWCQLFSEPNAGSDLPSLAAWATRTETGWQITGQKVWNTWAEKADFGILLARTSPDLPKREGLTCVILPMHQPGVEVRPLRQLTGDSEFNEVILDEAQAGDEHLLGSVDNGWAVARTVLSGERQNVSGPGSGGGLDNLGGRSVHRLLQRAAEANPAGRPADDAIWRQRLMKLWSEHQVMLWTNLRVRGARKSGREPGANSSIGKLFSTEHNKRLQEAWFDMTAMVADAGATEEGRRVRYGFLRSRANTIEGGTSQVQRNVLGEAILGLPREPDQYHGASWRDVPR
ncbi:MAG: acyl-CoA dehydrogenase family protein [Ilumatobacteraceae bacterium]|nr:acyl-CoA dehydrogenase family protein [Ilumatobacteraceae bacterium]